MTSVWNWLSRMIGARVNVSTKQRSVKARPGLEGLETREVLNAGGTGGLHSFVTLNGQISTPKQPTAIEFQIQPTQTVSDRGIPILLGLKAVSAGGSAVLPKITGVVSPSGQPATGVVTKGGTLFLDAMIPLSGPATYKIQVKGLEATTGQFQVDVFLPGDVNGDGRVDRVDLASIRAAYGSKAGGPRYNPAADFSQTGKVGLVDLGVARRNLGSTLSIVAVNQYPRAFGGSA